MELLRKELIEPREYQINIANTAIKGNTLVILPTGTGKTIIAIIVTANRLSKYPESKVMMLAPTRPLVLQHEKTFKKLFKIDSNRIVAITGKIPREERKFLYKFAKIIVATPQTIQNDLESNILNLSDFSLVIFDEAHRCVKEYAYTYVAEKYLEQSKFPLILALTASPGSEEERIEEIKNRLKIQFIEIRTEKDEDIRKYIKKIEYVYVYVDLPEEIKRAKENIEKVRNEIIDGLIKNGVLSSKEVKKKELIKLYENLLENEENFYNKQVFSSILLKVLQLIKIEYLLELLETQSLLAFLEYLDKLKQSKKVYEKALVNDIRIRISESIVRNFLEKEFVHPKIQKLEEIISYLVNQNPNVKIIVFANYRSTIEFIYKKLKERFKVAKLVGQASKEFSEGMTQKEQEEVIKAFANGIYNVLICSSVGEEGLDIPKTDYAIFYEPVPSEIRTIQRRGRVGRQTSGKVIILITKGTRDEAYYWAAFHKERKMRRIIYDIKKELANGSKNI